MSHVRAFEQLDKAIRADGASITRAQFTDSMSGPEEMGRCIEGFSDITLREEEVVIVGSVAVKACRLTSDVAAERLRVPGCHWVFWSRLDFELTEPEDDSSMGKHRVQCIRGFEQIDPVLLDKYFASPESNGLAQLDVAYKTLTSNTSSSRSDSKEQVVVSRSGLPLAIKLIKEAYPKATGLLLPEGDGSFGPNAVSGAVDWIAKNRYRSKKEVTAGRSPAYIRSGSRRRRA